MIIISRITLRIIKVRDNNISQGNESFTCEYFPHPTHCLKLMLDENVASEITVIIPR